MKHRQDILTNNAAVFLPNSTTLLTRPAELQQHRMPVSCSEWCPITNKSEMFSSVQNIQLYLTIYTTFHLNKVKKESFIRPVLGHA